jgi:hypothetical protein
MDHLDHLLSAAPPSLDGQHSIIESAHQLAGGMGQASRFDAMSRPCLWVPGIDL